MNLQKKLRLLLHSFVNWFRMTLQNQLEDSEETIKKRMRQMRTFPERLAALQPFWDSWYLDEFIGKGSFGEVYRIKKVDPFGGTYFAALKWLWIPQDVDDAYKKKKQGYLESQIHQLYENDAQTVKKEIEVMKRLNGESHVVGCEDFEIKKRNGDFGWDILIRMELLTPLTDYFSSGMTVGDVVKLGVDICSALEILEREKIIHRDIKPDNIFVTRTGSYKLGDFGVAKQFSQTYATMSMQGTPLYMAPEVYRNEAKTDYSVDLYSLGLVMHELLNRQRMPLVAFTDSIPTNAERDAAFLSRISGTAIPAPIDGTLDLKKIVCKACAFKSNKRYHSAIEMKNDLLALKVTPEFEKPLTPNPIEGVGLNSGRTPPRRISQEELAETIPSNNSEERSDEEPHPQPAPKPKKWKLVLPLFCLVFIVVGIIGITQSPPSPLHPTLPPTSVTSTPAPAPSSTIKAGQKEQNPYMNTIAVGSYSAIGLKENGTVVAEASWNEYGQGDTEKWTDIIAVAAADLHTIGVRADGTVVATGDNEHGQCDVSEWLDIVAVAAGNHHTIGLKADGTVVAVGANGSGQCNVGEWTDIEAVAAGFSHSIGLKTNGTVVAVGSNSKGQCDVSEWSDIVAVSAGRLSTVGLKKDGTVVAVGQNIAGQCDVSEWSDIVAIAAGERHTVGLKKDGTVVAAGTNDSGQCNVSNWTDIVAVAASSYSTMALKEDGTVVITGNSIGSSILQRNVTKWTSIGPNTTYIERPQKQAPYNDTGADTLPLYATSTPTPVSTLSPEELSRLYEYSILGDGTVSIDKYTGMHTSAVIPAEIEGRRVTTIGEDAFELNTMIKKVTIPEDVTCVGDMAFFGCTSLESVIIPEGVTSIGSYAFSRCKSLTNVSIPSTVLSMGINPFQGCDALSEMTIASDNSVFRVVDDALINQQNQEMVALLNHRRTEYSIPQGIVTIGFDAFSECKALKEVIIPEGVTTIGNSAFSGCDSLMRVSIPESVTNIKSLAFSFCPSLERVTIPEGVTTIGQAAFSECNSLTNVNIPSTVRLMGANPFQGCDALSEMTIASDNKVFQVVDDALINRQYKELTAFLNHGSTEYTIPEGIVTIGWNAFSECTALKKVTIPHGITSIGNSAFVGCTSLAEVNIPESITSIELLAFSGCDSLTNLNIPASVISIENAVFSNCPHLTLTVTSGSYAEAYAKENGIPYKSQSIEHSNSIHDANGQMLLIGYSNTDEYVLMSMEEDFSAQEAYTYALSRDDLITVTLRFSLDGQEIPIHSLALMIKNEQGARGSQIQLTEDGHYSLPIVICPGKYLLQIQTKPGCFAMVDSRITSGGEHCILFSSDDILDFN